MALGVQVNLGNGLNLDLFAAAPAAKPDFMQRESPQVWVQAGFFTVTRMVDKGV